MDVRNFGAAEQFAVGLLISTCLWYRLSRDGTDKSFLPLRPLHADLLALAYNCRARLPEKLLPFILRSTFSTCNANLPEANSNWYVQRVSFLLPCFL